MHISLVSFGNDRMSEWQSNCLWHQKLTGVTKNSSAMTSRSQLVP